MHKEKILILDFGSQTAALIARRIREFGVYTEIIAGDTPIFPHDLTDVKGIILSGSPESVYDQGVSPDKRIYTCDIPLFGICYGLQRLTVDLGGIVQPLPKAEYGGIEVEIEPINTLNALQKRFLQAFDKTIPLDSIIERKEPRELAPTPKKNITAWMSHRDTLTKLPEGFIQIGTSASNFPAVVCHKDKLWFGVQFHPEVSHCERGAELLAAFVFGVCNCNREWSMAFYLEETRKNLMDTVKNQPILLLISGGVDSTVAGALLLKLFPPKQVYLMYIDTGLMRKNETQAVKTTLESLGAENLHIIFAENEFFSALQGQNDPEIKRKIIGDLFISLQERETSKLGLPDSYFLAQGTLYTDLIESGKGVGAKAHVIKSHHNVNSPLVIAKRAAGKIIEPLDKLYKDEVRALGLLLGVEKSVINRHPFPGPGLAVRIIGEITKEKCEILREVDAIFMDELKKRLSPQGNSLYDEIWQAFAVLLSERSVGVTGDSRKYGRVIALRAIISHDGMTADVYHFAMQDLLEIAAHITNTVKEVGRVTYDLSSKPPATIEWE